MLHTGQHYDPSSRRSSSTSSSSSRRATGLETGSGTHGEQTGRMLPGIEAAVLEEQPDAVLVFGDTNSTLAGALAAGKLLVPVAHVEAGLRSFDRSMPEELNRTLVDRLSTLLFCPTEVGGNLDAEGITDGCPRRRRRDVRRQPPPGADRARALRRLDGLGVEPGSYLVAHAPPRGERRAGARLGRIVEALDRLDEPVVFPAHPRTSAALAAGGASSCRRTSACSPPLGYLDFAALASQARVILTDSGGSRRRRTGTASPA